PRPFRGGGGVGGTGAGGLAGRFRIGCASVRNRSLKRAALSYTTGTKGGCLEISSPCCGCVLRGLRRGPEPELRSERLQTAGRLEGRAAEQPAGACVERRPRTGTARRLRAPQRPTHHRRTYGAQ